MIRRRDLRAQRHQVRLAKERGAEMPQQIQTAEQQQQRSFVPRGPTTPGKK